MANPNVFFSDETARRAVDIALMEKLDRFLEAAKEKPPSKAVFEHIEKFRLHVGPSLRYWFDARLEELRKASAAAHPTAVAAVEDQTIADAIAGLEDLK